MYRHFKVNRLQREVKQKEFLKLGDFTIEGVGMNSVQSTLDINIWHQVKKCRFATLIYLTKLGNYHLAVYNYIYIYIYVNNLYKTIIYTTIWKFKFNKKVLIEVSYAHQVCIYCENSNTVKYYYNLNTFFYLNIF